MGKRELLYISVRIKVINEPSVVLLCKAPLFTKSGVGKCIGSVHVHNNWLNIYLLVVIDEKNW